MEISQLWKKTLFLWFPVENVAKSRVWYSTVSLSLLWPKGYHKGVLEMLMKGRPYTHEIMSPFLSRKSICFSHIHCLLPHGSSKISEILLLRQIIFWLPVCTLLAWSCWCADVHCGHCAAAWLDMLLIRRTGTSNWKSWNLFQQQQSQHSSLSIAAYPKAA